VSEHRVNRYPDSIIYAENVNPYIWSETGNVTKGLCTLQKEGLTSIKAWQLMSRFPLDPGFYPSLSHILFNVLRGDFSKVINARRSDG
jgi:hypothetical protein